MKITGFLSSLYQMLDCLTDFEQAAKMADIIGLARLQASSTGEITDTDIGRLVLRWWYMFQMAQNNLVVQLLDMHGQAPAKHQ